MSARTPTGELLVLALGRAVRLEQRAVLAEEAARPAADLWAMAAEVRVECGQPLLTARASVDTRRMAVNEWRGRVA